LIALPAISGILGDAVARFRIDIPRLELPHGALVYLLGPNGSGKSVYLKSLVGDFPSLNPHKIPVRGDAGPIDPVLIRQSADENLALGLTVLENMIVWDRAESIREYLFPATRKLRIQKRLTDFSPLGLSLNKAARQLSGGQKQGLVLLTRLSQSPQLLFLDEFTSAVDVQSSQKLLDVVCSVAQSLGTTSLIVTHDLLEASKRADACIVLSAGGLFDQLDLSGLAENDRYDRIRTALLGAWEAQVAQ
jgi:ABC-type multidrug transport system ATPase subunit